MNRQYLSIKIASLVLVGVALAAEMMPEVKAKMIVVPALLITLVLGIIEVKKKYPKKHDVDLE